MNWIDTSAEARSESSASAMGFQYRRLSIVLSFTVVLTGCAAEQELLDRDSVMAAIVSNINGAIAVDDAIERVARVCMENAGFNVHPPYEYESDEPNRSIELLLGDSVYTEPDLSLPADQIYGVGLNTGVSVTNLETAMDGSTVVAEEPDDFSVQSQEQQNEYFLAYSGSSNFEVESINLPDVGPSERAAGGCKREAEDAVAAGDYPNYLNHAGVAGAKGDTGWERDDRVVDARIEWSICMVEAGHDEYESPIDLKLGLTLEMITDYSVPGLNPESAEYDEVASAFDARIREVAEIDYACHDRTSLQEVQDEVYWEYMTKHVSAFEAQFFSFHEETKNMLVTAQEIISAGQL